MIGIGGDVGKYLIRMTLGSVQLPHFTLSSSTLSSTIEISHLRSLIECPTSSIIA